MTKTTHWTNSAWQKAQKPFSLSLLVAVYNKVDFFRKVFASIEVQSLQNFELVICDDGSSEQSQAELRALLKDSKIPTQHIWHSDQGVRKTEILNWGVIHSKSDYLVSIDGDCVLHPQFLEDHHSHREPGAVLAGRRMDLNSWVTDLLTEQKIRSGYIQKNLWWIIPLISYMKDNNGPKGIRIANEEWRQRFNEKPREIVGCNFSVYKKDLEAINGYDNRYHHGLGVGEDSDIDFRLRLNGVKIKAFCHLGIQYHLYHPLRDRGNENELIFQQVKNNRQAKSEIGIQEMLASSVPPT